jgi:hypothetical protein
MKNPLFPTALAAITATAVYLGAFGSVVVAQNAPANLPGATPPNPTATANPSGIFPAPAPSMPPRPPAAIAAPAPSLPSGVSEVMKLFKGGISTDITVSYINNSPLSFYLSADNLIALRQEGVPAPVLTAMMQRYGELQRQAGMAAAATAQVQAAPPQYAAAPDQTAAPQYYSYPPVQAPAQAPEPRYYSYAPVQPPPSYTYVAPPAYPVYEPYYYYDPFYSPWYPIGGPVVFDFGFGHFGGGFGGHFGGGGRFGGRR